jgi:hypothetical protein
MTIISFSKYFQPMQRARVHAEKGYGSDVLKRIADTTIPHRQGYG